MWGSRPDEPESFADLEDDDNDEQQELAEAAAMAVDRLSTALGGKCVFGCLAPLLVPCLQDAQDWGRRRGALITLALLTEGCKEQVAAQLPQLIPFLAAQLGQDPHPRVRYALLSCLGQLADDLCDEMQSEQHHLLPAHVLPVIVFSLSDANAVGTTHHLHLLYPPPFNTPSRPKL